MFTWICPKCGSEVPPSENDCPNCRAQARASAAANAQPTEELPPGLGPRVSSPPFTPAPTPPPPTHTTPSAYQPTPATGRPSLSPAMVAMFSAVGILALLAILYVFVLPNASSGRTSSVVLEKPAIASVDAPNAHPLAKYIEIAGLRISEGGSGQARIAFVAVNHSPADLPELDAHLTLTGGGQSVFDFPVVIPSIGPYESKDISITVKTQLKPYELPDWQALKPSLRIVSER